jgi:hypothetical protein
MMEQPPVFRGDRIAPIAAELSCGYCDAVLEDWQHVTVYPTGGWLSTHPDGQALLCSACWELFCAHEQWIEEQEGAGP